MRMPSGTILLLDQVHPEFPKMLESIGMKTEIRGDIGQTELTAIIGQYDGLVIRNTPAITRDILDVAQNLRFIARAGSGLEHVDYSYAQKKGIAVIHSPEGNADAVGEHALALTLCLLRKIMSSSIEVKQGLWQRESNRSTELGEKTIGIIGYGNTGSAFARKLSGMNVEILAFDKYKTGFSTDTVQEVSLERLLEKSDVVSFHVPLTSETFHYADEGFFQKCKNPVLLLNTSRGKVVSTAALVSALQSGKVFAAGLDVIEHETMDFKITYTGASDQFMFLIHSDNVIITPHIAGITHEARRKHALLLTEKIKQLQLFPE